MPIIKSELQTAQESLTSVKESLLAKDPAELTVDDMLAEFKATKALEAQQKAAQEQAQADSEKAQSDRLQAVSDALKAKGYIGDGSVADFKTLFEKDLAEFKAGKENFFGGKDTDELAKNYFGDGTNALDRLWTMVSMYDRS